MKKKEFLTEAKRNAIISEKEKAIVESFAKTFNKIKRLGEAELEESELLSEYQVDVDDEGWGVDDEGNRKFVGLQYANQTLPRWPFTSGKSYSRSSYSKPFSAGKEINPTEADIADLATFKRYLNSIGWYPKTTEKLQQMYNISKSKLAKKAKPIEVPPAEPTSQTPAPAPAAKPASQGNKINPTAADMESLETFKAYLASIGWRPGPEKLQQMYNNTKKWKKF